MNSFLRFFLALILLVWIAPAPPKTLAAEGSFTTSPLIVIIKPQSNGVINKKIKLSNTSNEPNFLHIELKPFINTSDGVLVYGTNDTSLAKRLLQTKQFIDKNISILDNNQPINNITLAPKQEKTLVLSVNIENIKNISEYMLSIFFISKGGAIPKAVEANQPEAKASANLSFGIGTHVIISSQTKSKFSIEDFSTSFLHLKEKVPFHLLVQNHGSNYIKLYGNIEIKDMFGQTVAKIRVPQEIILQGASKRLDNLFWENPYALGVYNARLAIHAEGAGQPLFSEVRFITFPAYPLISLMLSLLLIAYITSRIKAHINSD
jgi:hypothetical protein